MKNLRDYIFEKEEKETESENQETKETEDEDTVEDLTLTFNLGGLSDNESTIDELKEIDSEDIEIDGDEVTITLTSDNVNDLSKVGDIIKSFIDDCSNDEKRMENEDYLTKIDNLKSTLSKFNKFGK